MKKEQDFGGLRGRDMLVDSERTMNIEGGFRLFVLTTVVIWMALSYGNPLAALVEDAETSVPSLTASGSLLASF